MLLWENCLADVSGFHPYNDLVSSAFFVGVQQHLHVHLPTHQHWALVVLDRGFGLLLNSFRKSMHSYADLENLIRFQRKLDNVCLIDVVVRYIVSVLTFFNQLNRQRNEDQTEVSVSFGVLASLSSI